MLKMPHCSSCQVQIKPEDASAVRFNCPECNSFPIVRCGKCRKLGNTYTCHNCGFSGP